MASNLGTGSFFSGTGTETINLGMTGINTIDIIPEGNASRKPAQGAVYGTSQRAISDLNAPSVSGRAIQIKDNAGTIVFEAQWVSTIGTTVTFNKLINTIGTVTCLFKFSN